MKNNTSKKVNTAKKAATPETPVVSPIANCSRVSNFVANRCGESEKRISTHLPLLLLIPIVLMLIIKGTREWLLGISADIAALISESFSPVIVLVAMVVIISLIILIWWISLIKREIGRCERARDTRYYFYDDIIEFCTKTKRESFRAVNGIVSVKVTPAINNGFGPSFMTVLIALLSFNSKPLWQKKYGFRDVTIVTLGSPAETIVLHDVENPAELVNNIKLHYPQCNVESFGNGFNL